MSTMEDRELKLRMRCRKDFPYYAEKNLRILYKPGVGEMVQRVGPLILNAAQKHAHEKLEAQLDELGFIRALVLKGRQQGMSTYTEGRFYHRASQYRGVKVYILTHHTTATRNLFGMVDRFHKNCNPLLKPHLGRSNEREMVFDRIDSSYEVATAGAKGVGRSAMITHFHGSEVAFWENADAHLAGALQTVPRAAGTEVILESTANGIDNMFHALCQKAMAGEGDYILIFIPWFWQIEYRAEVPDDFQLVDDPASVPEGELTEVEYAQIYKLSDEQMYWRRLKISELGQKGDDGFRIFQQEYPATPQEAFQASIGDSWIAPSAVIKARKSNAASPGNMVLGVDPARFGDDATAIIRRRGRKAYNLQRFYKKSTTEVSRIVRAIYKAEKPARIFVDVGGLGAGVVDTLLEYDDVPPGVVIPVNFGEAAYDPDLNVDRTAEMYRELKLWLNQKGGVSIPDDDALHAELVSRSYKYDNLQRLKMQSKDEMRRKGQKSPDSADCLALTFAEPISGASAGKVMQAQTAFDPFTDTQPQIGEQGQAMIGFDPFQS